MKIKLLIISTIFLFCGQIAFSIYYSIKIVDENTKINRYQDNLINLFNQNQLLENKLSQLNSLKTIKTLSKTTSFVPIKTTIDLK